MLRNTKHVCLGQRGPANKSTVVLVGKQGIRGHIQKKKAARRVANRPRRFALPFPKSSGACEPGDCGVSTQERDTPSHPTPKADRRLIKGMKTAGSPLLAPRDSRTVLDESCRRRQAFS